MAEETRREDKVRVNGVADGEARDNQARADLMEMAERTAVALGRSVQGKPEETPIQTDVKSLHAIASLLAQMLDDARACGGAGCMGRTVGGVKTWVTADQFQVTAARTGRYADALRQIAASSERGYEFDMLVDWRETALALRRVASAALDEPGAPPSA